MARRFPAVLIAEVRGKTAPRRYPDSQTGEERQAPAQLVLELPGEDDALEQMTLRLGDEVRWDDVTFAELARGTMVEIGVIIGESAKAGMYVIPQRVRSAAPASVPA